MVVVRRHRRPNSALEMADSGHMVSFDHRIEKALANEVRAGRRSADAVTSARPLDAFASMAATHSPVGLAVVVNGEIRWANNAFEGAVGDLGAGIADQAARLEADQPTSLATLVDLVPDDGRSGIPLYGSVAEAFTVVASVTGSFGTSRSERTRSLDAVTGLPDRTEMEKALNGGSGQIPLDVMFIDVGGFDELIHRYGFRAGEQILREVGQRLLLASRAGDVVYRCEDDEFVVLGPDLSAADDAAGNTMARRLVRAVSSTPILIDDDEEVFISVTAGLGRVDSGSSGPAVTEGVDMAISRHDEKLGEASVAPERRPADRSTVDDRDEIREAIQGHRFELHYQPIVELESGETVGHEALLRLVLRHDRLLSPGQFMGQAEAMGVTDAIGEWVVSRAIHDLAHGAATRSRGMSINISPTHFESNTLVPYVESVIADLEVDPELLVIEITESAILSGRMEVGVQLKELAALGVRIALDDFGTGYSSLTHLSELQIDVIKLDNRFVDRIDMEGSDNSVAEVVIAVGRTLGCDVVAEGIERNEQRLALLALGCRYGQGYYFGYPAPLPRYSSEE